MLLGSFRGDAFLLRIKILCTIIVNKHLLLIVLLNSELISLFISLVWWITHYVLRVYELWKNLSLFHLVMLVLRIALDVVHLFLLGLDVAGGYLRPILFE